MKRVTKSKALLIAYVINFIVLIVTLNMYETPALGILLFIVISFFSGLCGYAEEYPQKNRRQFFSDMFRQIGLVSSDGSAPYFIREENLSEYTKAITFHTLIPLSEWQKRKEELEMYLNDKIIEFTSDLQDNRIVYILIRLKPLPTYFEWDNYYMNRDDNILNLGICHLGILGVDLEKHPHGFIAGETGSGKSNLLKCMIYQSLGKGYDVILIDFKRGVSFSSFSDYVRVYYDYQETMQVLKEMVEETKRRLDLFRETKVDNLNDYNNFTTDYLDRKVIFIDELAELLKTRDKEISNILYDSIETLTRLSRAVGIHLIMGIQRPDSTIVNGQIKNNVSFRVCGHFVDKEPSRIMLGNDMASTLDNIKGRFIVKDGYLTEVQTFYYSDKYTYTSNRQNLPVREEKAPHSEPQQAKQEKEPSEPKKTPDKIAFDFSDIEK